MGIVKDFSARSTRGTSTKEELMEGRAGGPNVGVSGGGGDAVGHSATETLGVGGCGNTGDDALRSLSLDELVAEKRRLQRRLHDFEHTFKTAHGIVL